MRRDVLRAIVAWLRVHDRSGTQVTDTPRHYPTGVELSVPTVAQEGKGVQVPTPPYKAERYDYTRQAWIGTDGRWLCCAHLPEHRCQCYGRLHAGELAQGAALPTTLEERVNKRMQELGQAVASAVPARPPTINQWPAHERRGYDQYVRELAYLEQVLAEERKGRYGRQADEDEDDEDVRCLREETCTRCGQPESEHGGIEGWCRSEDEDKPWSTRHRFEQHWDESHDTDDIASALDEQRRRAWEQECDEIHAQEELERMQRLDDERREDL